MARLEKKSAELETEIQSKRDQLKRLDTVSITFLLKGAESQGVCLCRRWSL